MEPLAQLVLYVLVGLVLATAVGCAVALLRVILPGLARQSDRSLATLSAKRLIVVGALPLVGALLVLAALHAWALPPAAALLVVVPVGLLLVAGAMAALPKAGGDLVPGLRSPLARAVTGAVALGFALVTWAFQPLGLLVTSLIAAWFLGAGIGTVVPARGERPAEPPLT
jgi:hypothetical protein